MWRALIAGLGFAAAAAAPSAPPLGAPLDPAAFRYARPLASDAAGLVQITLDAPALAHSRGQFGGFADLRILDASNRQVPYIIERGGAPVVIDVPITPVASPKAVEPYAGRGRSSSYQLTLPVANLPVSYLTVDTTASVFTREVRIGMERAADRLHRDTWFDVVARAPWTHVDGQAGSASLTIELGFIHTNTPLLVIDEGDNAPLPISGASLTVPAYRVRFFNPGGPLRLMYGRNDLTAPQYDLALLAGEISASSAREIVPAPETAPDDGVDARKPLISSLAFWIALAIAVVVLLGLIVRLVRKGAANEGT